MYKKIISLTSAATMTLAFPLTVLAKGGNQPNINLAPPNQFASLSNVTFSSIVSALVGIVLIIAAIVFFFMLIIGGIKYIVSGGDKGQTEAARNQITAALVGLVIVFAAYAIISIVNAFFNVDLLNLEIPQAFQ